MALPQAGVELVAEGLSGFMGDMGRANQAVADFGKSGAEAGSVFEKGFGEIITGALREVGANVVDALAEAGKALFDFGAESVTLAGDFEAGMNQFRVAAGKDLDTQGLQEFHDLFIQLGKDLPVSTSDVQQAAIELVKGGIDPATVAAGGLEQAIKFAGAAMEGDLVGAAEISSKIVAGWADVSATAADKAALLSHSTDLLTKAANASSTDVNQLSQGLFNAQGIAKTAGVSLDDLTTVIGELAGDFNSSAEAGTSLKNFIARLQPTTDPAAQAMAALGLYTEETGSAFYDAQGNFVGFQQASQLLQDSLAGLTKEQQAAALQTIFGNDAMSAAAGLASRGAEGYQVFADQLANAMGVQEAAATVQAGYNTALTNAQGSLEAMQIQIGEQLLPILTSFLNDVVTPGINVLSDFASAVFGSDEALGNLSPSLQAIVSIIDVLVADTQEVVGAFNDAGAGSSEFAEAIGQLATDLGLPGDLIQTLVLGLQDLIGALSDSGASSDALGDAVEDLSGIWEKYIGIVQNVLGGYLSIAQSVLPIVTKFVEEHGDEIAAFFKSSYDQVIRIVNLALDLYNAIVPPALESVARWVDEHATGIEAVISGAWDVISGVIRGALTLIEGTIKTALALINGDWEGAWAAIQEMSAKFVLELGQVIQGGLNIIAGFFNTNLAEIGQVWQNNWDQLVTIAMKIGDRMVEAGRSVIEGILKGLRDNAGQVIDFLIGLAKDAFDAFMEGIAGGSPAMEFVPAGQSIAQGIMLGLSQEWSSLTKLMGDLSDGLVDKARSLGEDIQGAIAESFGATASIDRQIARNLDSLATDVLPDYLNYTQGALKEAENQARAFLDPQEGAKYFKMRSDQILEYAKLQKDLADAETSADRERIKQQMLLINRAQEATIKEFNANLGAGQSTTEKLMEDVGDFLRSTTKNEKGEEVPVFPGILDNPLIALFDKWLKEVGSYNPYSAYVNPPASQQQMAARSSGPVYNQQRSYTMPIYTNMTPAAIQDSMAIAQAILP